jgi:hypothetical protein
MAYQTYMAPESEFDRLRDLVRSLTMRIWGTRFKYRRILLYGGRAGL